MKPRHSYSLLLVWRIAELEARNLNASEIEPVHLLIGLAKIVDLDLPALVSKDNADRDAILEELLREVRRLRTVFSTAHAKPSMLRRKLRGTPLDRRFSIIESENLHRSAAARTVFTDAENLALLAGSIVYPAHLLYAVLLHEDKTCAAGFDLLGIDRKRFLEVAKREVMLARNENIASRGSTKSRWN